MKEMTKTKHKEYRYIAGLIQHDSRTIEEIYAKYSKAIVKLVQQNNGTKDDAKDVLQEALVVIYQKVKYTDFELTSSFFSFFYAVCRNVWWRMLKKNKNNYKNLSIEGDILLVDDINISEELSKKERYEFYIQKLKKLGEGCQRLLELHFDGKKMPEIVQILGLSSVRYAASRKYKCKQQLVKLIENDANFSEFTF
jgi:RNA polymerase sigma factor (sigma-70 family)